MAYSGYHFFVGDLELPYAPSKLKVTIGSNNKTVDLISGNEINILKSPKLTEIEFDIELPRGRQYAFANKLISSKTYTDYFEKLMLEKTPVKLVITRPNPFLKQANSIGGTKADFESTVLTVSLEGYSLSESADNAYDIVASLKFKEYISYATIKKTVTNTNGSAKASTVKSVTKPVTKNTNHKVQSGDTLISISRKYYGTDSKWKTIYETNKTVIEETAAKHGRKSSSNGHWIYPGTVLIIPKSTK